jgi:hypothetical protein
MEVMAAMRVLTRRDLRSRRFTTGLLAVVLLAGCTTTTIIDGWTVTCASTAADVCQAVAGLALNNMARSAPSSPTATIRVERRSGCPPVPDWADGSACWNAQVPLAAGAEVCIVVAYRPALGGYGQVGGDEVSGLVPKPGPSVVPGCP